jgi:hypothetical protein
MHRITLRRQFPVEENILEILQFRKSVFLIAWTPRCQSPDAQHREQKSYEGSNGAADAEVREQKSGRSSDGPVDANHREQKSA